MEKQFKIWNKSFQNFIGNKENFCVVRILNKPDSIIKDYEKSKEFEKKEDAVNYFNIIKNDYVEGYEVLTSIFKGTEIDEVFWKIKNCPKIVDLKLNL